MRNSPSGWCMDIVPTDRQERECGRTARSACFGRRRGVCGGLISQMSVRPLQGRIVKSTLRQRQRYERLCLTQRQQALHSVRRRVAPGRLVATGAAAALADALGLNRRTRHRSVGTEHAAIAGLRLQLCTAAGAFIEKLTGIRRHGLLFRQGAVWTGDGRFQKHRISPWARTDSPPF